MTTEPSLFTRIINRELPSTILFENEDIIVINNIHPKAPVHLLGITKKPYTSIQDLVESGDSKLLMELFKALVDVAKKQGLRDSGYRLVSNIGEAAGQTVFHLHVHLMGGTQLPE